MKTNMGTFDRVIRAILGVIIIAAGLVVKNWWGAIGLIPLATAVASFCPLYEPFHIKTLSKKK